MYSNELENDINLKQGKILKNFNNTHEKYIDFKTIMTTCTPDICTIKETMSSARGGGNYNSAKTLMKDIQVLDDKFSRILSQYNSIQRQIKDEMIKNANNYDTWKNHLGKVVVNNDNYYYVNDYGYTHKYKKGLTYQDNCPTVDDAVRINDDMLESLPDGPKLRLRQPCSIAGKNIRNARTDEYAYVDIKGIKHIYSSDSWKNKSKTCNSTAINLNNSQYRSIPTGSNMTDTDLCIKTNVSPTLFKEMYRLNDELTNVGKELHDKISTLNIKDLQLKENVNNKSKQIYDYIQSLEKEKMDAANYAKDFDTLEAQEESSEIKLNSDYLHYLAFTLGALAIGGLTVRILSNSN